MQINLLYVSTNYMSIKWSHNLGISLFNHWTWGVGWFPWAVLTQQIQSVGPMLSIQRHFKDAFQLFFTECMMTTIKIKTTPFFFNYIWLVNFLMWYPKTSPSLNLKKKKNSRGGASLKSNIVTLILYCRIYSFHYSEIIEKNWIIKKVVIFQHCLKKPL